MSSFDPISLTRDLVRADSRNPDLIAGAPGEAGAAEVLRAALEQWGFRVEMQEAAPGRPNVIARIGGGGRGGRSLMLNGHLDTVGTEGMTHDPLGAEERGGRLYGRGSSDMKAGIAAMCAAAARAAARGTLAGEVIVAAVADEEYESVGTRALVASGVRADAAIITEPTRLAICPAHRGFAWLTVTVHGRAAHGSRYDIGVDAIRLTGLLLGELDVLERELLPTRVHPLLGRASMHASLIEGGIGMSTYPDRCVLKLERRTVPGESAADFAREVREAGERVRGRRPEYRATIEPGFAQGPSDVATDAPIVAALEASLAAAGESVRIEGMPAWTDAALLNEAGIPTVCFGPGDIALAHAAEEYVEVAEIERATRVLEELVGRWCGGGRPQDR